MNHIVKIGDPVYISNSNSIGFVIDRFNRLDIRTDTDGVVNFGQYFKIESKEQLEAIESQIKLFYCNGIKKQLTEYFK